MGYRMMGRIHARLHLGARDARRRLESQTGQGTVEYVALMLLVAGLMAGVIATAKGLKGANLAQTITGKLKETIDTVGKQ
jgi:hypothetical protein